ncbi:MAG: glutaminase [Flavobacteriaceae bacterium]
MVHFQSILENITNQVAPISEKGQLPTYIPELTQVDIHKFGMALLDNEGNTYTVGDAHEGFSIQSISKVLALAKAFSLLGDQLWKRVGVEPSGDPFNHLSLLEMENGIPRNPLINAGALVVCDVLVSEMKDPKQEFLEYVRAITHDYSIQYDTSVAQSESDTGFKNYAAAYLLKSFGNLTNPVRDVLDLYFHLCALKMSCFQLTRAFYPFANRGKCIENTSYLSIHQVKRINAIMLTCGFYDEAGEFAFEVGLPGKSGVGGGIVALLPNQFCVATWSPGLNEKGNSKLGMLALEKLTTETKYSIF